MSGYMNKAKRDDWGTPRNFFNELNEIWGFNLDVAASTENALCDRFYTKEDDALKHHWNLGHDGPTVVWCNPPYGRGLNDWVSKAILEWDSHHCSAIVMLLPSRTGTKWFHMLNDHPECEIRFNRGRLKFEGAEYSAPFDTILAVFQ